MFSDLIEGFKEEDLVYVKLFYLTVQRKGYSDNYFNQLYSFYLKKKKSLDRLPQLQENIP